MAEIYLSKVKEEFLLNKRFPRPLRWPVAGPPPTLLRLVDPPNTSPIVWLEGVFRRDWEFRGMRLLSVLFGWETWEFWWDGDGDGELRKELPPFQYVGRSR